MSRGTGRGATLQKGTTKACRWSRLGASAEGFRSALRALPDGYPRDCGVYQARAALATLGDDDPEGAAELGLGDLTTGAAIRSGRIVVDLVPPDHALTRTDTMAPVVRDFREAMKETFPRHA